MAAIYQKDGKSLYDFNGQTYDANTGRTLSGDAPLANAAPGVTTDITAPVNLQQVPLSKPVTTVSSETPTNKYIPDLNNRLSTLTSSGGTRQTYTDQGGFLRYGDDLSLVEAPDDAQPNESGAWESGGQTYGSAPHYSDDPTSNALMAAQIKGLDASTRAKVTSIQKMYDIYKKQQEDINSRYTAGVDQTMLMGGSSRYAQVSSAGIVDTAMSYGVQQLAALDAQEQNMVQSAKDAQASGNYQIMSKAIDQAEKIREQKQAATEKMNQKLQDAVDAQQKQKIQASRDGAISDLLAQGVTDPNQIMSYLNAYDNGDSTGGNFTAEEISKSLGFLSKPNDPLVSSAMSWVTDAAKNGADPKLVQQAMSLARTNPSGAMAMLAGALSDPYKAQKDALALEQAQANLKKTRAEANQAAGGKMLSVNDALALGVPFGTTEAQAYGKGVIESLKPSDKDFKIAQDLAYGSLTMPQFKQLYANTKNTVQKQNMYVTAKELNPNFDPAAFELGYTFAANPKIREQVSSLDSIGDATQKVIDASDNAVRTGTGLNDLVVKGGIALGNKQYSTMRLARAAYANELADALGYRSADDLSRDIGFDITDQNLSAAQFKDGIEQVVAPFLASKRSSLVNAMGIYGKVMNQQASGVAGQGAGTVKMKDPKTGDVWTFNQMSPADWQSALDEGWSPVQK